MTLPDRIAERGRHEGREREGGRGGGGRWERERWRERESVRAHALTRDRPTGRYILA